MNTDMNKDQEMLDETRVMAVSYTHLILHYLIMDTLRYNIRKQLKIARLTNL